MIAMNGLRLLSEKRSITYLMLLGVWGIVALYAILHDQYIVRIAPEHFTVYHEPLLGIEDPIRLAAVYAFWASFSPGLLLGMACVVVARGGAEPRIPVRFVLKGVLVVVVLTEVVSASVGYYVYRSEQGVYPDSWYPEYSVPLLVTQSIQVTCYFVSAFFSCLLLLGMMGQRYRWKKRGDKRGDKRETPLG